MLLILLLFFPTANDGDAQDCAEVFQQTCTPRLDLLDIHFPNIDLEVFIDDSALCSTKTGNCHVGHAMVISHDTLQGG